MSSEPIYREFVHLPAFERTAKGLVSDDDLREFLFFLAQHPTAGATVAGTGGVRKIRVGLPGRGKRGGARLIYYYLQRDEVIYLLFVYPKNQQESLTAEQKKLMKALVDQLEGKD